MPIFSELVEPLQEAWDAAEEGQTQVLPIVQDVTGSARKPLLAAIEVAGGQPWKKLLDRTAGHTRHRTARVVPDSRGRGVARP